MGECTKANPWLMLYIYNSSASIVIDRLGYRGELATESLAMVDSSKAEGPSNDPRLEGAE